MVFTQDFVLSVLLNGKVVKENGAQSAPGSGITGLVKIPFGSEYQLRLRNKHNLPCAVDIYIDGERVNDVGQLVIWGNEFIDLEGFLKKNGVNRKFQFVKLDDSRVRQPGESQNGIIEARFYLQKEANIDITKVIHEEHHYHHRPYWVYDPWNYYWPWYPWNHPYRYHDNYIGSGVEHHGGVSSTAVAKRKENITFGASIGKDNQVNCNHIEMSALFSSPEGATVEGSQHNQQVNKVPKFELVSDPVVLKIKLEGYEIKQLRCFCCGTEFEKNWKYCNNCGGKL